MLNKLHTYFLLSQGVSSMNYFKEIIGDGPAKNLTCLLTAASSYIIGSFVPLYSILLVLLILVVTDAILGCKVSLKRGNKCESRRLWKTLRKFGWCGAIVWFANRINTDILVSFDAHLVEFFAGAIAGVELWSIIENLSELYPNGPWKVLSKFIKAKGEKYLDITIDKEDLPKVKTLVKKIK